MMLTDVFQRPRTSDKADSRETTSRSPQDGHRVRVDFDQVTASASRCRAQRAVVRGGPAGTHRNVTLPIRSPYIMEQDTELGTSANAARIVNVPVPAPGEAQETLAYPPDQAREQPHVQSERSFSDPSGPLFSMYLERAEEEDKRMVENWKGDADGILVFTGLFSASVVTFLGNTYQGLQLNSQDASAFYLSRIYQQSASDNGSQVSIPSTISDPTGFTPSTTTVWVNALWFLSLVISLTCALLATMLQQWARHYLHVTRTRYQPYKRARIRSFYAEGVEKFRVSWAIDVLPTLLHLSVFLFYAGLSVLLFSIDLIIFKIVVSWVALCLSLYVVITILPAIFPNSPYRTPLSTLCWMASLYILRPPVNVLMHIFDYLSDIFRILIPVWHVFNTFQTGLQVLVMSGMLKSAEKAAMSQPPDTDSRALAWTYDSLDEDHEFEQFLAGVLGLLESKMVGQPAVLLARMEALSRRDDLVHGALDLISRPIGPSLSPHAAQRRRFKICSEVAFALLPAHSLHNIWDWSWSDRSDFYLALERMAKDPDQDLVIAANSMAHLSLLSLLQLGYLV
ncbi:hypothetical protein BC834DRAFT_1035039 [Gloeopeniophorella convolvens]|nr:hypothetical protein BC834DRAFT_1035039 [Gloeopeniophorella convolvens]